MANYRTGQDLVNAVLNVAGELTDGTSDYQNDALVYLSVLYRGLLSGGNIFGVDVADPWTWALAKRPILFTMQPSIGNVSATLTQFSYAGTFNTPPLDVTGSPVSVQGWFITITGRDEWFCIKQHVANTTTFQIDMPYTEASITLSTCNLVKLDYDLIDDSIFVDQYSTSVDFVEASGNTLTATLAQGIYTPAQYATAVALAMTSAGTQTYSGSWSEITRLFTWSAPGVFSLLNASGPNAPYNASQSMGLDVLDYTGENSYVASYPLNAINRLTAPMLTYRQPNTPWRNPRNEGKIYALSFDTFSREYPFTMCQRGMPDKFCITKVSDTGIVTIRLNGYFDGNAGQPPSRIEVNYIPKMQDIQNVSTFIPVVPEEHRKFLVDGAASMLMNDKTDSKAEKREQIAKAGLMALQHHQRRDSSVAGINYGKLVPRYGMTQKRWWWQIS